MEFMVKLILAFMAAAWILYRDPTTRNNAPISALASLAVAIAMWGKIGPWLIDAAKALYEEFRPK